MSIATSIYASALNSIALIKTYLGTDVKEDLESSRSAVYDVRANDWNLKVSGLSELALRMRIGNIVCVSWSHPNVATGGPTHMYRGSGADVNLTELIVPWDGFIVAMSAHSENDRIAGDCVFNYEKNTVAGTLSTTIDGTTVNDAYDTQLPNDPIGEETSNVDTFSAGDILEVTFTATTWNAGATPSAVVDLWLAMGV